MRKITDKEKLHIAKIIEKEIRGTPPALFGSSALEMASSEATIKIENYLIMRDKKTLKMMSIP